MGFYILVFVQRYSDNSFIQCHKASVWMVELSVWLCRHATCLGWWTFGLKCGWGWVDIVFHSFLDELVFQSAGCFQSLWTYSSFLFPKNTVFGNTLRHFESTLHIFCTMGLEQMQPPLRPYKSQPLHICSFKNTMANLVASSKCCLGDFN